MKYMNVIMYMPGLAGRFTQCLTSLHPTTQPLAPTTDAISNRLDFYSYKNLHTHYAHWRNHHLRFSELDTKLCNEFLTSPYTQYNYCTHPHEFYIQLRTDSYLCAVLQNKIPRGNCQVRYLQIALDTEYEPLIAEFKVKNRNLPFVRPDEEIKNSHFTKDYNPYIINLDNYFIGESNFLDEYTKLMDYLGIPAQVDLALQLYQGWIEARNSTP
jgi:hypothetical protein